MQGSYLLKYCGKKEIEKRDGSIITTDVFMCKEDKDTINIFPNEQVKPKIEKLKEDDLVNVKMQTNENNGRTYYRILDIKAAPAQVSAVGS